MHSSEKVSPAKIWQASRTTPRAYGTTLLTTISTCAASLRSAGRSGSAPPLTLMSSFGASRKPQLERTHAVALGSPAPAQLALSSRPPHCTGPSGPRASQRYTAAGLATSATTR